MRPRTPPRRAATNLQQIASSFVGRESDIAALIACLEHGPLVTVIAPGGMGKTRLALRFAGDRLAAYSAHRGGGVWFCDLSEARGVGDIVASVAAALEVGLAGLESDAASCDAVGRAIARRGRVLVVLDNFDRLAADAPATLGRWLDLAPSARFLVTSRVPLDLPGEQRWTLAPLARDEAVELFVRRARLVQPSFDAAADPALVGEIVDAIDRMPLAIELAATRMSILSPAQLRARLKTSREILAGRRDVGRHASMRRTVLDSVDLLGPGPRRLFASCAVMRNGFTLEAAEAVLADEALPRAAVMDALETLVRHSLLRVALEPGDDAARYAFFETIRDVADEFLASEPARAALLGRHAGYYASLCTRLLSNTDARRASDLAAHAREVENLLQAHQTAVASALDSGDPVQSRARASDAVALALGLDMVLSARGLSPLRARLLDEALGALTAVTSTDAALHAEVYLARGLARSELGDGTRARADFEMALSHARTAGKPGLIAAALIRLGGVSDVVGDTEEARARYDEAIALLDAAPRDGARVRLEAEVRLRQGHAYRREGDLSRARAAIMASAGLYRDLGDDEGLAMAMYELAVVEMFAGDQVAAFAHFDEGLRVAERGGVRVMTGALKTARGCLLQDVGRLDEALDHHAEAARAFREIDSRFREASALYYLATTYYERGDAAETEAVLRRACERLEGVGAARYEALTSGCLACALADLGRRDEAEAAMDRAERAGARVRREPALTCNLRIHRLALDARARGFHDVGAALAEAEALARAHPSDDSRFALRAFRAAAAGVRRDPGALVVTAGGRSFTPPGAREPVVLPERSPLRRILEHLARKRIESPGEAVTIDEVVRVAWPGEKIGADAALNRAYVALAALRKMGLRDVLLHADGGYSFSQSIVVRLENKRD